ncbi:MAG: bifunctional demethylmenaquinone methyltransferase/2-methoxy-6-polyprenyl-1,4-benzoquinol methylase UbiE [Acidobacteria bacterium]|nr:MAG: bifunctional demethylmenaquinone methyltransferase/2-methoxy-6-polyprenyl-1,4-benzoquinol methylase UbiE [Acidobacteriota bacterium]RLE23777.1 MAG: bifunctional demethylmenaquinone methyltransferase/2-methoxy-6-polyprenyl-1,4-benzoquinol methylase UbiE [Acidobacteriota bacterium]
MSHEQEPAKIKSMFNSIARRYDFLNHFFSFNIDAMWRRRTVNAVATKTPELILDVAAGTMDLSVVFSRKFPEADVIALDFACEMLSGGLQKLKNRRVYPINGDGLALPFLDNTVDIVSIAFGIRNLESLDKGLREFYRVLKPGGTLLVLEFTPNRNPLFNLYSGIFMPLVGRLVSKDPDAYHYLHRSVKAFPPAGELKNRMENAGFSTVQYKKMTMGIAALHVGNKDKFK